MAKRVKGDGSSEPGLHRGIAGLREITIHWESRTPKALVYAWRAKKSGREVDALEPQMVRRLQSETRLSITDVRFDFYEPTASLRLHSQYVKRKTISLCESGPLEGVISLWGPGTPAVATSLPEPREFLLSGEKGFLACDLSNRGGVPIALERIDLKTGIASDPITCAPPHLAISKSALVALPILVPRNVKPGFYDAVLSLEGAAGAEPLWIEKTFTIGVARLISFEHSVKAVSKTELEFDLSVGAELPNGFQEKARTTGRILFAVGKKCDVRVSLRPTAYEATLIVPGRLDGWGEQVSQSILTNFEILAEGLPPVGDAKQAFQVATATLMAFARWVGVQATKALIAGASQLLGPEVGVPVALVLYSPPVEAEFALLMAATGAVSGALMNGKLYDKLFA